MNLSQFLAQTDGPPNQWIRERHMDVYVRKSSRYINGQMIDCLDFASVEVDEGYRGKGYLKKFLVRFERAAGRLNRAVYIESILEPRLAPFFAKRGYRFVPNTAMIAPSMYKIV